MEHRLYPEVVGWYGAGRLRLEGERVLLDDAPLTRPVQRREDALLRPAEA